MTVLLIYPALQRNIQVRLWHLCYGNVFRLQEYDVPIPLDWIAHRSGGSTVDLWEVGVHRTRNEFGSMIVISNGLELKLGDLASSQNERYISSQDAQVFDRRTIDFDAERADCIVSDAFVHKLPSAPPNIISINCASTAGLSITFQGNKEYIDTFYSVVSQIRRHDGEAKPTAADGLN